MRKITDQLAEICVEFEQSGDYRLKKMAKILRRIMNANIAGRRVELQLYEAPAQIMIGWPDYRQQVCKLQELVHQCFLDQGQPKIVALGNDIYKVMEALRLNKKIVLLTSKNSTRI